MRRDRGSDRLFVITGGPGAGKSTLIEALARAGYACSDEVGRRIIKDQMVKSGSALPWIDPQRFADAMFATEIENYARFSSGTGAVFFDRGIPDVIGYLRLMNLPVPSRMTEAAAHRRYNRRVFIAPPWPEIFAQDEERKQTPEEAERTHAAMVEVYTGLGYDMVELPRLPVDARAALVLEQAGLSR
jgi:predicted ATPase